MPDQLSGRLDGRHTGRSVMKRTVLVLGLCLTATFAFAQPPGGGGGQRPPMTPEQQAAMAAKRQAEMNAPRPIDALDSVWMEELTWMEVRDAIKEGKTTAPHPDRRRRIERAVPGDRQAQLRVSR